MVDIAFKIKAKNGVLQEFIDEKHWTQSQFATQIDSCPSEVGKWFNMRSYPHNPEIMLKISDLIGKMPEEIFPFPLMHKDWLLAPKSRTVHKDIEPEMLYLGSVDLLPESTEGTIDPKEIQIAIHDVISTLTPREERVIRRKFGIGSYDEQTYAEIAKDDGVSTERIRQIERKALRKLRHPSSTRVIRNAMETV